MRVAATTCTERNARETGRVLSRATHRSGAPLQIADSAVVVARSRVKPEDGAAAVSRRDNCMAIRQKYATSVVLRRPKPADTWREGINGFGRAKNDEKSYVYLVTKNLNFRRCKKFRLQIYPPAEQRVRVHVRVHVRVQLYTYGSTVRKYKGITRAT